MQIKRAETAGYCFGVGRAMGALEQLLREGQKVAMLGPIIHNATAVARLEEAGARVIGTIDDVRPGETVVIRSHGVPDETLRELAARGVAVMDATCPFVSKIHRIVAAVPPGETVLIAGNPGHPEVLGIIGHCAGKPRVFSGVEELEKILRELPEGAGVTVVAQTTLEVEQWEKIVRRAKELCTNARIFDTICDATQKRQREALALSRDCDAVLVVGDRGSSNTRKLYELCSAHCKTYLIEKAEDLDPSMLEAVEKVGLTTGASTPDFIIKEVFLTMSELEKQALAEEEFNFDKALEDSIKVVRVGGKVVGVVTSVSANEVQVDIGTKHAGYIPADELSEDSSKRPDELVAKGDELELIVMRVNDQEGTVMLSKRRYDASLGYEKIVAAHENDEAIDGTVVEIIKGGVIVLTNGMRVFVPASLATASRGEDLESLKGKDVTLKIIELGRGRRRAVGSIRATLQAERDKKREAFWAEVEEGKVYRGPVKSLTSYGAFVDLGGVDGMVHISELSWRRLRHPSEVVSVGQEIEVYVKSADPEKGRVSLGYKKEEDNGWVQFVRQFSAGDVVEGPVVSTPAFGAFVNIFMDVDGLVHISQLSHRRVEKVQDAVRKGQVVKVKILGINEEQKQVSLSIKACVNPEDEVFPEPLPAKAADEEPVEAAPAVDEELLEEALAEAPDVADLDVIAASEATSTKEPTAESVEELDVPTCEDPDEE